MAKKRVSKKESTVAVAVPAPAPVAAAPIASEPIAAVSLENLGIEWKPKADGSAELKVAYEGPLAGRGEVVARAGTWRAGSGPWAETRELPLRREGARWVGVIPVASGAPVQGVEFVFRAADEWDNGGRAPLGYYEWNPNERRIEVR